MPLSSLLPSRASCLHREHDINTREKRNSESYLALNAAHNGSAIVRVERETATADRANEEGRYAHEFGGEAKVNSGQATCIAADINVCL